MTINSNQMILLIVKSNDIVNRTCASYVACCSIDHQISTFDKYKKKDK